MREGDRELDFEKAFEHLPPPPTHDNGVPDQEHVAVNGDDGNDDDGDDNVAADDDRDLEQSVDEEGVDLLADDHRCSSDQEDDDRDADDDGDYGDDDDDGNADDDDDLGRCKTFNPRREVWERLGKTSLLLRETKGPSIN